MTENSPVELKEHENGELQRLKTGCLFVRKIDRK